MTHKEYDECTKRANDMARHAFLNAYTLQGEERARFVEELAQYIIRLKTRERIRADTNIIRSQLAAGLPSEPPEWQRHGEARLRLNFDVHWRALELLASDE